MLAIDVADQLASSNSGRRRIKKRAWQALDQWLLVTTLVNCYLVAFYSDIEGERQVKFRSQQDFRLQIIDALLVMGNFKSIRYINLGMNVQLLMEMMFINDFTNIITTL